jgi:hypothetical protein
MISDRPFPAADIPCSCLGVNNFSETTIINSATTIVILFKTFSYEIEKRRY